jgi:hypothetical protein
MELFAGDIDGICVAVGYLLDLAGHGVGVHDMESATRLTGPTSDRSASERGTGDPALHPVRQPHRESWEHRVAWDKRGIAIHREPDTVTVDDLLEAAAYRIESARSPIPFKRQE